jgi:hypothetical protein
MKLKRWIAQAWPFPAGRGIVVSQYQILSRQKLVLADIALRGYVFSAAPSSTNLFEAGIAEGKRRMALETIRLANTDPAILLDFIERKPQPETRS